MTCSVGTTPERPALVWKLDTRTSVSLTVKYSCCSVPALRQISSALLRCWPSAQARNSTGEALLTFMTKSTSFMDTLLAPPPPPEDCVAGWLSPQDHNSRSMAPLDFIVASYDSPLTPSTIRK